MAALHPHAHCFEVDHPSTQTAKRAALADAAPAANLYFVPADLSVRSLADVLASHPRFDASRTTLVVIEGVLMYLPVAAVTNFFRELAALFQNGLTCIFTFMDRRADGDIQFKTAHPAVRWWLQRKRERFLWGIERTRIADFLVAAGFANSVSYGTADFERILFAGESPLLAEGELIGVATR